MTHTQATKMVLGKRNRSQRKIGNNTYAYIQADGSVAIELHGTNVVVIYADDSVMLNSGSNDMIALFFKRRGNSLDNGIV